MLAEGGAGVGRADSALTPAALALGGRELVGNVRTRPLIDAVGQRVQALGQPRPQRDISRIYDAHKRGLCLAASPSA